MPASVFVSYRRDDSASQALNVAQYLENALGAGEVFFDLNHLRAGDNFKKVLEARLDKCGHMLAVIGPNWLYAQDGLGRRRIDDPEDWVRIEVSRALARSIRVIPVLVNGATLPRRDELPDDLKALPDHHAVRITTDGFRHEMAGLMQDISSIEPKRSLKGVWQFVAVVAVIFAGASLNGYLKSGTPPYVNQYSELADRSAALSDPMIDTWQTYLNRWPQGRFSTEATRLLSERRRTRLIRTFPGYKEGVTCALFSPDGRSVLTNANYYIDRDERFTLYDARSGVKINEFGKTDAVRCVVFSPDGRSLVSYGYTGELSWWDATNPKKQFIQYQAEKHIHQIAFVGNSPHLVTANGDGTVRLRDTKQDRELHIFRGHTGDAWNVTVSPTGRYAVSGGNDGTLRVWDIDSRTAVRVLTIDGKRAHQGRSWAGIFAKDGLTFISSGDDGIIRTWNIETGAQPRPPFTAHRGAASVTITPDGRYLVTGGADNSDRLIKLWDATTHAEVLRLEGHTGDVWPVTVSPDGRMIVSAGKDDFVRLWDISDLAQPAQRGTAAR